MDLILWTAVAAVVIGAFVRAIKSDGATIALANLGLPPVPKRALPWIALALGALSAVLDARVNGVGWQTAAAFGVLSAGGAIVGHDLGRGVPGIGKMLAFAVAFGLPAAACAVGKASVRPAAFAAELARCEASSSSWAKYSPCCAEVYRRFPLPDGGPRDAADCQAPSTRATDGGAP